MSNVRDIKVLKALRAMAWNQYVEKKTGGGGMMPDITPAATHKWNADGETCLNCGEKDWRAGPTCTPKKPAPVDDEALIDWQAEILTSTKFIRERAALIIERGVKNTFPVQIIERTHVIDAAVKNARPQTIAVKPVGYLDDETAKSIQEDGAGGWAKMQTSAGGEYNTPVYLQPQAIDGE